MATPRKYSSIYNKYPKETDIEAIKTKLIFEGHHLSENNRAKLLLSENEFMKQELYQRQSEELNRLYTVMREYTTHNKSEYNRQVKQTAKFFNMSAHNIYSLHYDIFDNIVGRFSVPKIKGKSKLFMIWSVGLLPILFIVSKVTDSFIRYLRTISPRGMKQVMADIEAYYKRVETNKKKYLDKSQQSN
jgi:hypothetical protein